MRGFAGYSEPMSKKEWLWTIGIFIGLTAFFASDWIPFWLKQVVGGILLIFIVIMILISSMA
jgi:hypothetical protein